MTQRYNKQQIFDIGIRNTIKQNGPAWDQRENCCSYLDREGKQCHIGVFMSKYLCENIGPIGYLGKFAVGFAEWINDTFDDDISIKFLSDFQAVHDDKTFLVVSGEITLDEWFAGYRERCIQFASDYVLNPDVTTEIP